MAGFLLDRVALLPRQPLTWSRLAGPCYGNQIATLTVHGTDYAVDVVLVGHFEPLDGRYHWYGRVAAHAGLEPEQRVRRGLGVLTNLKGRPRA